MVIIGVVFVVVACSGGGLSIGPRSTFAIRADLDARSPCVLDPDPTNGGKPDPPAEIVAAGDPTDPSGAVAVTAVGLGDVVLPSDRMLVGDFFYLGASELSNLPSVALTGFTGRAPACLHVAQFDPPDQRAAFLHVRLAREPVVRWDVGTAAFGVDGGTGGIASTEAVRAAYDDRTEAYIDALETHSVDTWAWANVITDPASGANVIGFSTGWGDGGYPVYTGHAQDGRVVSIVIDLLVLPWRWLGRVGPGALPVGRGTKG
jgi:Protein of unknown function (DUF4241)